MSKHDRIIADLITALDAIQREATKPDGSRPFILGLASQAIYACNTERERNSDGYLVVKA